MPVFAATRRPAPLFLLVLVFLAGARAQTFTNPLRGGPDPWVLRKDGYYYLTATRGNRIDVIKSPTAAGLSTAPAVVVWRAPQSGLNNSDIWAPEIHFLNGKWYIYYTATQNRSDPNRRIFVLEATSPDPLGRYIDRGKIAAPGSDEYAIDATIYRRTDGALFMLWSGRQVSAHGPQNIYIAPMRDPLTLSGPRVLLSTPTYDWEKHGWHVNEGPEVLYRNGKTFVVYSGSGASTSNYCLGLLTNTDGNLLNAASWSKSPVPVFSQYSGPDGNVYTPGHNGFFTTPDGKEDWIVYHGKDDTDGTMGGRSTRMQRFFWNADDTPFFGHPIPAGVRLAVPSGDWAGPPPPNTGAGTGLLADYFQAPNLLASSVKRADPAVRFDWGLGAPAAGIGADGFSVRWRGQVQPRYSETYTFQLYVEDGARLWVNGQKIIDDWTKRAVPAVLRGSVPLVAGQRTDLVLEYFEGNARARAQMEWFSPSQPFEIVPQSQLYPP